MWNWAGPLHMAVRSLRALAGCLLGITGLVEQEGKGEMEFYDCLKVV